MVRKTIISLIALMFILSFSGLSFAADKGNSRKGKYTYRKVYEQCHEQGVVDTKKPPISPDEKTQAQWQRLFDKKDFSEFGCKEEWDKLTEEDLLNIFTYLHDHAADSPTPAKCK